MLVIKHVDQGLEEIEIVKKLFQEYAVELNENLCFQRFDEELKDPLKKYGEPYGCLLIAYWDAVPAGCVALQPIKENSLCEMKRLFVRVNMRGHKIADGLIRMLLVEAEKKGYKKMVLDTLERLQPAVKLYEKHGFIQTLPYYQNPLPAVVFMEKSII